MEGTWGGPRLSGGACGADAPEQRITREQGAASHDKISHALRQQLRSSVAQLGACGPRRRGRVRQRSAWAAAPAAGGRGGGLWPGRGARHSTAQQATRQPSSQAAAAAAAEAVHLQQQQQYSTHPTASSARMCCAPGPRAWCAPQRSAPPRPTRSASRRSHAAGLRRGLFECSRVVGLEAHQAAVSATTRGLLAGGTGQDAPGRTELGCARRRLASQGGANLTALPCMLLSQGWPLRSSPRSCDLTSHTRHPQAEVDPPRRPCTDLGSPQPQHPAR